MESKKFLFDTEISWEDLGQGVQRKILGYDERLMVVKVKFEAGAIGVVHQHPHTQSTYVESGIFELSIGDEMKIIRKGDGFCVPADTPHGVVCMEAGMLIDAFSPVREDFLR